MVFNYKYFVSGSFNYNQALSNTQMFKLHCGNSK